MPSPVLQSPSGWASNFCLSGKSFVFNGPLSAKPALVTGRRNAKSWKRPGAAPPSGQPAYAPDLTLDQLARLIVNKMPNPRAGGPRVDVFMQLEGAIVRAALEGTRGNKQAAANLLGLYCPRLYSMLGKHNLHDTIRESDHNVAEQEADDQTVGEPEAHDYQPRAEDAASHTPPASDPAAARSMGSAAFRL